MTRLEWDGDDINRNEVVFLREIMPGEPGYKAPEPVEGVVVEREGITVRELVAKLQGFDQSLVVFTNDNEYGFEPAVDATVLTLEKNSMLSGYAQTQTGLNPGDSFVLLQ